jgi:3-phosphoshikimate 1-carboxyvinyltransferase
MNAIRLAHRTQEVSANIQLPGSKSESNRALILQALSKNAFKIHNLSEARDTQNLVTNLNNKSLQINILDAGTSMRFLTAYYCAANLHKVISGTARMAERPIAPLTEALAELGFSVNYKDKQGFPPIEIHPVEDLKRIGNKCTIPGNISSQFITALILIAPFLYKGLTIYFSTVITSKPYVDMSLSMLRLLGVEYDWSSPGKLVIKHQPISATDIYIESDWSSAGYWFSIAALAERSNILLEGLKESSLQGDSAIAKFAEQFGVQGIFEKNGIRLSKSVFISSSYTINFIDNPDLAQTIIVLAAAMNIPAKFTGLESLRIKETDRIAALQKELLKCGVQLMEYTSNHFQLSGNFMQPKDIINTYQDHRMAMAFAPLALLGPITIESPSVVEKSYPRFWQHLLKAGFSIEEIV